MEEKQRWRATAKADRRTMAIDSAGHCRHLARFLDRHVAADAWVVIYDAMPSEVDLRPLIEDVGQAARRFAVTRTPDEGYVLSVHPHDSETELHPYGYRQPMATAPVVQDRDIEAVLVPALAFDRCGVRLGRGKGYYDRFLGRLGDHVLKVGITGDYVVDALPAEPFDVSMTHLATSTGVWPVPLPSARPA